MHRNMKRDTIKQKEMKLKDGDEVGEESHDQSTNYITYIFSTSCFWNIIYKLQIYLFHFFFFFNKLHFSQAEFGITDMWHVLRRHITFHESFSSLSLVASQHLRFLMNMVWSEVQQTSQEIFYSRVKFSLPSALGTVTWSLCEIKRWKFKDTLVYKYHESVTIINQQKNFTIHNVYKWINM